MLGSSKGMEGREGREMREERVVTGGRLVVVGTWKPTNCSRKYKKHKYKIYEYELHENINEYKIYKNILFRIGDLRKEGALREGSLQA